MRHYIQADHPACADKVKFFIGDIRNYESIREAVDGVDFIFHAAALKEVPSCEFFPMEAVKTNIIGTDNLIRAAVEAMVKNVVCLSTDKAAYPINAMGISKAMMEKVARANALKAYTKGGTIVSCTRYGNVMCSRGSIIPLFIEQIKTGKPITITNPSMTRFLMNLDASTIEVLGMAVQQLFGDTGIRIIGSRHGEKLYETLMTKEELVRAEDMGNYFRVTPDNRDLNYDNYIQSGDFTKVQMDDDYNSHNTTLLDVEGTVRKILTAEYVKEQLEGWERK